MIYNLGNVVGMLRSVEPPKKPYVLWGKILDPAVPNVVELRIYRGSGEVDNENNWKTLLTLGGSVVINWADVEGKPPIFTAAEVLDGFLLFKDGQGNIISRVSVASIINDADVDFLADYIGGKTL